MTEVPDDQRDEKIREGCEVYASAVKRATQGERTISMDELTSVQALERKHPDLPMQPDHVLRREFEYIRHGTLSWFINFDVVTGQVVEPSNGSTRTEEDALAHLQRLIANDPQAKKWHLIMDNLNIHQSEALVRWIAEREGIAVEAMLHPHVFPGLRFFEVKISHSSLNIDYVELPLVALKKIRGIERQVHIMQVM